MPFVLSALRTLLPFHGHSHPRAWPDLHCRPVYKAFCEVQGVWEASLGPEDVPYETWGCVEFCWARRAQKEQLD